MTDARTVSGRATGHAISDDGVPDTRLLAHGRYPGRWPRRVDGHVPRAAPRDAEDGRDLARPLGRGDQDEVAPPDLQPGQVAGDDIRSRPEFAVTYRRAAGQRRGGGRCPARGRPQRIVKERAAAGKGVGSEGL